MGDRQANENPLWLTTRHAGTLLEKARKEVPLHRAAWLNLLKGFAQSSNLWAKAETIADRVCVCPGMRVRADRVCTCALAYASNRTSAAFEGLHTNPSFLSLNHQEPPHHQHIRKDAHALWRSLSPWFSLCLWQRNTASVAAFRKVSCTESPDRTHDGAVTVTVGTRTCDACAPPSATTSSSSSNTTNTTKKESAARWSIFSWSNLSPVRNVTVALGDVC